MCERPAAAVFAVLVRSVLDSVAPIQNWRVLRDREARHPFRALTQRREKGQRPIHLQ